jgi:N,N'-diacetyllegionaminate synthase
MKIEVIAEIGSNWEGDLKKAEKLIKLCKKSGADAVKFQMWRADDLYQKNIPHYNEIKKAEVTFEKAKKIKKICDKYKIEFFCSVFYPDAVEFLEKLGIKRYKIASYTAKLGHKFSSETIMKKAKTRKPIIISLGMGGNRKKLTEIFSKNKDLVYCYCIADYPTAFEKINWKKAVKYNGFSDHSLGIIAPIIYSTLKKKQNSKKILIEKHVKLENSKGPDAETSMTVDELKEMIFYLRKIENTSF